MFYGPVAAAMSTKETITNKLREAFTPESLEGIGEAEARRSRWIAAALWVIAAVLVLSFFWGW